MKKNDMVKKIQEREAELWCDLQRYEFLNAPDDGDIVNLNKWISEDIEFQKRSSAWDAVNSIMQDMGIEPDYMLPAYETAAIYHSRFHERCKFNKENRK